MGWPFFRVSESGDVAAGGRQHARQHRVGLVFLRQFQREEERAVFVVEFDDEHWSPISPRRGGRYVSKRARFRILLPPAQKLDREARLIGVDQLGAEFAQPDSIAGRAAFLLRQRGIVSLAAERRGCDMRRLSDIDEPVFGRLARVRIVAARNSSRFVIPKSNAGHAFAVLTSHLAGPAQPGGLHTVEFAYWNLSYIRFFKLAFSLIICYIVKYG
jgi:hypothetical protein